MYVWYTQPIVQPPAGLNDLHPDAKLMRKPQELELTALAPVGERVARNRRFHQPGRVG